MRRLALLCVTLLFLQNEVQGKNFSIYVQIIIALWELFRSYYFLGSTTRHVCLWDANSYNSMHIQRNGSYSNLVHQCYQLQLVSIEVTLSGYFSGKWICAGHICGSLAVKCYIVQVWIPQFRRGKCKWSVVY